VIRSFFTFVAPSHGDESGSITSPHKDTGEQLLSHGAHGLEAFFTITRTDRGNNQMIVVLENPVPEAQRQLVLLSIYGVFCRVESVFHAEQYTGIPYFL
jgi:hypothetical protein